jgi:hypothetical protein
MHLHGCHYHCQAEPLIYRIDEDPSERFPLSPTDNEAEYTAQLVIARLAVQEHINRFARVLRRSSRSDQPQCVHDLALPGWMCVCVCVCVCVLTLHTRQHTRALSSLTPVVNQIALGDDSHTVANGGSALCCNASVNNECNCNPNNMLVFVCPDNDDSGPARGAMKSDVVRDIKGDALASTHAAAADGRGPSDNAANVTAAAVDGRGPSDNAANVTAAAADGRGPSDNAANVTAAAVDGTDKPNVVMLFVDDSGYADTGVFGAPSTNTPSINMMASQGARFTQWYTAHAICTPSRAALMTGRLPIRYGLASTQKGEQSVFTCTSKLGLPHTETSLATLLKSGGYRTGMIGKVS